MKEAPFIVYARRGVSERPPTRLPDGYRFELWKPSALRLRPPHQPIRYAAWWLFDRAHVFSSQEFAVGLVWKGDRLIHRVGIFPRWYRWPFMKDRYDLQFGDLWTDPAYRGLGVAPAALHLAMAAGARRERTFWYLTHETNTASIRTAERAGFSRVGHAVRTRKLGLSQLGQYELSTEASAESRRHSRAIDYSLVTEIGGDLGSRAQLRRAYARYYFAGRFGEGRDVLEVACGAGQGLGYLAGRARSVTGLDIDPTNLAAARATYRDRDGVSVIEGDAQELPFKAGSFDVVLLFEAIYYLREPERFVSEARRVLRPGGTLLLCTANKDVSGFNPGALTHRHFGVRELATLLEGQGFKAEIFASGAVAATTRARAFRASKRAAVRMGLIPNTLKMRAVIKRLFFGPLVRLPREIEEGVADCDPVVSISSAAPTKRHEVILAVGRLPATPRQ